MFEWHFTIRGPADSEFAGGVYHGRILLPPEYPFKPPNIVFLTPSGRFETNTKVCLSFSAHHPELWQPAWGIRLILEALISFLPTPADGAIGALDWTKEERQKLAKESVKFHCPACCAMGQSCTELLPELKKEEDDGDKMMKKSKFQEEIEKLKMLQFQNHAAVEEETADGAGSKEEKSEQSSTDKKETLKTPLSEGGAQKEVDEAEKKTETKSQPETALLPDEKEEQSSNNDASSNVNATPEQSSTSDNKAESPSTTKNTNTAEVASNATNAPATAAPPSINNQRGDTPVTVPPPPQDNVIVSDPFLNGMIAAFAVVVVYLLREAHSLLEELRAIQSQL